MTQLKKELNSWQFVFEHYRANPAVYGGGWRHLNIGFMKYVEFPAEGERITWGKHYKGVLVLWMWWWPGQRF